LLKFSFFKASPSEIIDNLVREQTPGMQRKGFNALNTGALSALKVH
jgi:hypothetical protein